MELRFVPPHLHALDDHPAEVIACAVWSDERPMRGLAGLLDWRLAGRVSRLAKEQFVTGSVGEVLCMQGRPRLPFDKVVVVGAGERAGRGGRRPLAGARPAELARGGQFDHAVDAVGQHQRVDTDDR